MVTTEELRNSIRKFNQKAEELLLQEEHDSARLYLDFVKNLQKELDDLTGEGVPRLDVPCCLGMLLVPQPRARDLWLWRLGWVGDDPWW